LTKTIFKQITVTKWTQKFFIIEFGEKGEQADKIAEVMFPGRGN
jgi:hypothetical protein